MSQGSAISHTMRHGQARWRHLRTVPVSALPDADWVADGIDPDTLVLTVGGTASDGEYSATFTRGATPGQLNAAATFERDSGETDADIAEELEDALGVLAKPVDQNGSEGPLHYLVRDISRSSAAISVVLQPYISQPFDMVTDAPGAGTLVANRTQWPITAGLPTASGNNVGTPSFVEVALIPLDTNGLPVAPTGTVTATPIIMIPRPKSEPRDVARAGQSLVVGLGQIFEIPVNGADRWTVRLSGADSLPGSATHIRVEYRIARG